MVLQGPRGVALKALGEAADHEVATRTVADIELRRQRSLPPGPSVDAAETRLLRERRNAVRRGTDLALTASAAGVLQTSRPQALFGAVYEYRDACGTPKVVASTSTAPERQFALDQMHYEGALPRASEPALVWVGVSGGGGRLDEADMAEVRRAVASRRAERLRAQKLADIKPYSRHG